MIIIIHGEDIVSSRRRFIEIKETSSNPHTFDGEKVSLTELVQILEGGSLFADETSVFIENLLSRKKGEASSDDIAKYLAQHTDASIVLWEGKELTKSQLNKLPKAKAELFKIQQNIFSFLEHLAPGRGKELISECAQLRKNSEDEFVLYMVIRQIRLLLAVLNPDSEQIDEARRLAPWQSSRLTMQAKRFTEQSLIENFTKLTELDTQLKTGTNALPAGASIDFFLLSL